MPRMPAQQKMNYTHQNYHRTSNSHNSEFKNLGAGYNSVTTDQRLKESNRKNQPHLGTNGQIQPFKLVAFPKLLSDNDAFADGHSGQSGYAVNPSAMQALTGSTALSQHAKNMN